MAFKTISQNQIGKASALNSQTIRTGTSTGGALITSIIVTDSGFNDLDDTAIGTSNSFIKIIGTGFASNANVYISGTQVPVANVTFTSSTELRVVMPVLSAGNNVLSIFNSTGSGAIYASNLLSSGFPTVTTSSYTVGGLTVVNQLLATGDGTLTYALKSGSSLPAGLTLAANGLISGTTTSDGTTIFTVLVSDSQNQTTQQDITFVVSTVDAYFNTTTLLLQAENVSNNAINNSFVDSSNNYNIVVSAGTPIQGSINPFGTGIWSNSFGSGNYLSGPANAAFVMERLNSFTIEAWVYPTSYSGDNCIFNVAGSYGVTFYVTGGTLRLKGYNASDVISSATVPALNTWSHVAVTRVGGSFRIFVNGVLTASAGNSDYDFSNYGAAVIGNTGAGTAPWTGYISNLRINKGTGLYTATFTPSTTPLTSISGTSILTCQSNSFRDSSTNGFALTVTGSPTVQRLNPFDVNANSYTTSANTFVGSTYYGSGYQYFTKTGFGTGDFSIEFWAYPTANGGSIYNDYNDHPYYGAFGIYINFQNSRFEVYSQYAYTYSYLTGVADGKLTAGTSLSLNQWYHVAVCRTSGTVSLFLNGTRTGTSTYAQNLFNTQAGIGNNGSGSSYQGNSQFAGYVSNFRIVTGSSAYNAASSSLTVPTSPLTVIANTTLLTCTSSNSNKIDVATGTVLTTVSTVTQSDRVPPTLYSGYSDTSTANTIYSGSYYFNGSTDYLSVASNASVKLAANNFTIEAWVYFNSVASGQSPMGDASALSSWSWGFYTQSSGALHYFLSSDGSTWNVASAILVGNITVGQWYHVALVRNGSTFTPYLNGVAGTPTTSSATLYTTSTALTVGTLRSDAGFFNGYVSNPRIVKGTALYTSAFTPPTAPLQPIANTSLLLSGTNSGIYDGTMQNNIRIVGTSTASNTFTKTGLGSMYFPGSSALVMPSSKSFDFGTGDFTVEFWLYYLGGNGYVCIFSNAGATNYIYYGLNNGTKNPFIWSDANILTTSTAVTNGVWQHHAVTRNNGTVRIFLDGVSLGNTTWTANISSTGVAPLSIGANSDGTQSVNGYIDNFRVTDGYARYTANFSPPIEMNSKSRQA